MSLKLANNAVSKLASALTATDASLAVVPGDGAKFPTLAAGDWFPITVLKSDGTFEIMRCTARATDALTITRAQEGTAAIAFSAGDRVELRWTKAAADDFQSKTAAAQSAADAAQSAANAAQAAANTAQAAADAARSVADTGKATADAALPKSGGSLTGLLKFKTGANIASAATVDLTAATGNTVHITGTTTISAWTMTAGQVMDVIFDGALTLTHHATNNNLPGSKDIATASGDSARIFYDGTEVSVRAYTRADGSAVQAAGFRQTWQNLTGSRVAGTSYTNTTGKPITVSVCVRATSGTPDAQLAVDGLPISQASVTTSNDVALQAMVPPGSSYLVQTTAGASFAQIVGWMELR